MTVRVRARWLVLRGLLATTIGVTPALAQIAPGPAVQVPEGVREGVPSRQQVEAPTAPAAAPQRSVRVDANGAIQAGPCPLLGSTATVSLKAVRFTTPGGGEIASKLADALAPVTHVESGDKPIAMVCEIRDRANKALRESGYVASVQIPPQEIAGGQLQLVVVAAHLTEVRVTGAGGRLREQIDARVREIQSLDPFNAREAEHILLLASDIPGLTLRLTLRSAGTAPGDVIGELQVDVKPVLIIANYQNTGSKALGPSIFSARGEVYGLTGLADRTYLGFSNSAQWNEVHVVQGGHDMALGHGGVRIGIRGSYAESEPTIPNLELKSRSVVAGVDLSAPLYRAQLHGPGRTKDWRLYTGTGFEILNQRTDLGSTAGKAPFTDDRLRYFYARAGAELRVLDLLGAQRYHFDGVVELRKGANILNATRLGQSSGGYLPTRIDGDPDAFEVRATLNQTIQPTNALAFDLSVFGQWANHALLNLEEFSLGNLTYGLGYDPGANGGDRAVAVHLEPRWRLPIPGLAIEATAFYDRVRLWNLDQGTTEKDRVFNSAGGGVRVTLPGHFTADVTYAHTLDKALLFDSGHPRDRVLLTFTSQLFPWRAGR